MIFYFLAITSFCTFVTLTTCYLVVNPRSANDVIVNLSESESSIQEQKDFKKNKTIKYNKKYFEQVEHYLPLVMERLVMTVEAGLDIVAGIKVIVDQAKELDDLDVVTQMLSEVLYKTEAGLGLTESLKEVADQLNIPVVKHAFIHLALAHKQGGELIVPLRELSDATQLQYQERVDEKIAKLPVKATLPLVIIFTGLLLFLVTAPIIQVINMTTSQGLS